MAIIGRDGMKYYTPHEDLVELLNAELHRRKAIKAGKEPVSEDEKKKLGKIYRMKVYHLDKHIFQSMANLVFFFEALARHPELEELYRDIVNDLLGLRRSKSSGRESGFVFSDLLRSILGVGESPYEERKDANEYDFSLILADIAQQMVRHKVSSSLSVGYRQQKDHPREVMLDNFANEGVRQNIVEEFDRILRWTRALASGVAQGLEKEEEPRRTFDFSADELLK